MRNPHAGGEGLRDPDRDYGRIGCARAWQLQEVGHGRRRQRGVGRAVVGKGGEEQRGGIRPEKTF